MAKLVNTTIYIGDKLINQFTEFALQQSMYDHHKFRIVCPGDIFQADDPYSKTKKLIGELCKVSIANFDGSGEPLQFKGIVTEIISDKFSGHTGDLIIIGYSPTILMDNVGHCKTWDKKALKNIMTDIAGTFGSNILRFQTKPRSHETLAYTVQYRETAWQFINRLAATHGEWLFYNGKQLIFGEFEASSTDLVFGSTLNHFSVAMQLRPQSFANVAYDYLNSETYSVSPQGIPGKAGLNDLGKFAYNKSNEVYTTAPKSYTHQNVTNKTQLEQTVATKAAAQSSNLVRFKGNSTKFGVQLGNAVKVSNNYGNFKIIDVTHTCDGQGHYVNDFIAIPDSIMAPPVTGYVEPFCETQTAVVTDNFDKTGLGRIRVRFHWMNDNEKTPWIRVVNPHAGSDKGVFFMPEKDEHVLIAFENGNPAKPYVIGAVYHGKSNAMGLNNNEGNDIKAIKTRSGVKIIINDKDGSILIEDKASNKINIDGKGNIDMSSSATINISSPKINLNGDEITMTATKSITGTAQTILSDASNSNTVKGTSSAELSSAAKVDVSAPETLVEGKAKVTVQGADATVNGTAKTGIISAGPTSVEGAVVKLN
jgi:type VI secretion system secreted protein VgrG